MPARPEGVYADNRGQWYFKVSLGKDAVSGRREQITRRGYSTASEAAKARRDLIGKLDAGLVKPSAGVLTVNELLDLYLDGLDADQRLSPKTRHDYRVYAQNYATLMLANGVAPKVAAERLGHSDRSLFMNLYSHVTPSMQREAADMIGAVLFG